MGTLDQKVSWFTQQSLEQEHHGADLGTWCHPVGGCLRSFVPRHGKDIREIDLQETVSEAALQRMRVLTTLGTRP